MTVWRAIQDKDVIIAVVRGSGDGQDGWTNVVTLPNAEAQAELIRTTYSAAYLPTTQTAVVETTAEATGTSRELPGGSIKSNIGHLEAASGIAGLIKAILMVEKAQILATVGIQQLSQMPLFPCLL